MIRFPEQVIAGRKLKHFSPTCLAARSPLRAKPSSLTIEVEREIVLPAAIVNRKQETSGTAG